MTTTEPTPSVAEQRIGELCMRLFEAFTGVEDVVTVYVGERLGLYRAIGSGSVTSKELAQATATDERLIREWLEQQAVTGFLTVDDTTAAAQERRYSFPEGHDTVFLDKDHPAYLAEMPRFVAGLGANLPALLESFRTGKGVPWSAFGPDAYETQAALTRVQYINFLSSWFEQIPDVHERLSKGGRAADIACGGGWAAISLAKAYPKTKVDGYDLDDASIALARRNAEEAGVAGRVRFEVSDAGDAKIDGTYDLVTIYEALHDMGRPVDALRTAKRILAPGGAVVIADEKVNEQFTAPGDLPERFFYGASVLFCLHNGLADAPSVGTGTVMRPDTLRAYASEAGFSSVEVLPIENEMWRFYRLNP